MIKIYKANNGGLSFECAGMIIKNIERLLLQCFSQVCNIQIFNSFHLSMTKFRNLFSHVRATRRPLHLDDCARGHKSSCTCTNQCLIAPRVTPKRARAAR